MARIRAAEYEARNEKIRALRGKEEVARVAEQFGLSVPHVYRIWGANPHTPLHPHPTSPAPYTGEERARRARPGGDTFAAVEKTSRFKQTAATGLRRYAGAVDDDYDRVFRQGLERRMRLFREMGDDPICAAVLMAHKMMVRKANLRVAALPTPGTDKMPDANQKAAEFVEQCLDDMSQSRSDTIDGALGMLQYGFAPAEIVYKKRTPQPPPPPGLPHQRRADRGGDEGGRSKYNDGRIGWRKWVFMAQDSLAAGEEWDWDENGGVQGLTQSAPPDYKPVYVPIEKLILFRTSSERGNPEGRSLFRAMYKPWYFKNNLEEIEGISAERMGSGLPVFYLGSDVDKNADDAESDFNYFKDIVRNVRVDEQMGLVLPFAKMGGGAKEGEGVLFELVRPNGAGMDFHPMITRYEQRMAMVGLGQFLMLGMEKIGTQALAQEQGDTFTLAVEGFMQSMMDTINRYAVERLMRMNHFPGLTAYPEVRYEYPGKPNLGDLAEYVNKLVGSQVLTPGPELEEYLRKVAELPEKSEEAETPIPSPSPEIRGRESDEGEVVSEIVPDDEAEVETEDTDGHDEGVDEFAGNYGAKAGQVIAGALGRGAGGKFVRAGAGGGGASPAGIARAVGLSEAEFIGLKDLRLGKPLTESMAASLEKRGLAVRVNGGLTLTPAGKKFMDAVGRGDLAGARIALGANASGGKGVGKGKGKGAAEKKGKGGGGGKGDAAAAKAAEAEAKFKDTALRLLDMDDQELAQDMLNVLTKNGQPVNEANGKVMAQYGFVDRDAKGNWILTARGRAWGKAAMQGDLGAAFRAMQIKPDKFFENTEYGIQNTEAHWAEEFSANHTGVMVALWPSPQVANALAIADGEPVNELHVTLAYLGKADALSVEQQAKLQTVVEAWAKTMPALRGEITGPAVFAPKDGVQPLVALVDVPTLPEWRESLLEMLERNGFAVSREHGYIPHITRKYCEENAPLLEYATPVLPLKFEEVVVVIGGVQYRFALQPEGLEAAFDDLRAALAKLNAESENV